MAKFDEDPFDQTAARADYVRAARRKDRDETDQNREIYEQGRADAEQALSVEPETVDDSEPVAVSRKGPRSTAPLNRGSARKGGRRGGSDAAGVILGFYVYVGFLVPYLRGGAPAVRQWHRAKFLNKPDEAVAATVTERYAQTAGSGPDTQPVAPSAVVAVSGS